MTIGAQQTFALAEWFIPLLIVRLFTMVSIFGAFAATGILYEPLLRRNTLLRLLLFAATVAGCMITQRNFDVFSGVSVDMLDKDGNLLFFVHCTLIRR